VGKKKQKKHQELKTTLINSATL